MRRFSIGGKTRQDIVKYGDEDDPAILCTDQYSIYDGIDEYDEIDGHLQRVIE